MTRRPWAFLLACSVAAAAGCDRRADAPPVAAPRPADSESAGPDLFEDVTAASGVNHTYRNGEETANHLAILESLGGGVALIDFDKDGRLDVYVPGGGDYAGPDKKQIVGHAGKLYRNLGDFKFADATAAAGLDAPAGGWFYSHAAAVGDFDRDGWPDLLVTGWRRVGLFRNVSDGKGGRRFEDATAAAGLAAGIEWATSAAFADLDGDGWADLYVCQYVNWSWDNHPACDYDGKTPDVCPPKRFRGLQHKLYRNAGGRFEDVSAAAGLKPGGEGGKGLGVLVVDLNGDGKPDVYAANDTEANFLYLNESTPGTIRLKEVGMQAMVALDASGAPNGSMGLDAGDPDGRGKPDIWVTNYENELHALYRNMASRDRTFFLFQTPASGIGAIGQKFVGWGTGFLDTDNHGWQDLFIANGHAIRYPTGTTRRQKPVLLRNRGGKFTDITPRGGEYFRREHLARGAALGDLDNDGRTDIVVSHVNEPVAVLRNVAPTAGHHWLGVELARPGHADVVGARVTVEAGGKAYARFARGGGSYASAPDRRLVFGLGAADKIDKVAVEWPGGRRQEWAGPAADRYHTLTEDAAPVGKK